MPASSCTTLRRGSNAERVRRSFNGRMRDQLLNETLFFTVCQARLILTLWVDDCNTAWPHSSLGYATPAAFAV
jgi:putative transposase